MQDALKYSAPAVTVDIGSHTVLALQDMVLTTARQTPVDQVELTLRSDEIEVARDDDLVVFAGYGNDQGLVFGGQVDEVDDTDAFRIVGTDAMRRLQERKVSQSFRMCTPAMVAGWLGDVLGLPIVAPQSASLKHSMAFNDMAALDVLRACDHAWGLDWDLYAEPEGWAYWGPMELSPRFQDDTTHTFEEGLNIISLTPGEGVHHLTAVYDPFVQHSSKAIVYDPVLFGGARICVVDRAVHKLGRLLSEVTCREI